MITVQWQSPQNDGGAPVNYTITVSSGSSLLTTTEVGTHAEVAVTYNVVYTVSILATNCNGSSSVVMDTVKIGMLP